MASAAESIEKGADREIANLNERIRAMEQDMSAMKEFIKEAIVQSNWPGGNSSRPVTADDPGSSGVGAEEKTVNKGFESDNSNMESKPKEMGETGREEVGFKILKESEFNRRMRMGLCVLCDKKYRKNHNRKCKNKNVRLQVVKDEDEICDYEKTEEIKKEEVEQEENVRAHQFKFLGNIKSRDVIVFVGLSATHNFISKELVNSLGIPLQWTQRRFRVNFVCRPGSEGAKVCEGIVLKTQGIEIVETFFVIDLAIADVVLGNQWLRSLGDTKLQGMPMSLTFKWHGRTVKLQADPSLSKRNEIGIMMLEWI